MALDMAVDDTYSTPLALSCDTYARYQGNRLSVGSGNIALGEADAGMREVVSIRLFYIKRERMGRGADPEASGRN